MAGLPIENRGLRHLALRVRDVAASKRFYTEVFGMHAVWEPDAQTVYLSGARDNLALHEHSEETDPPADARRSLDHLGFIVASPAHVYAAAEAIRAHGITIVQEPREHRDGSHSFYLVDPDNNVIQVLYEPNISPLA